jgi:hypothetical protein
MFYDRYLFDIALAGAERYKQQCLESVDPATVNKEVNCLKAMLNKVGRSDHLKDNSPRGISALKEPPGQLRYLTPEQKAWLLAVCGTPPYCRSCHVHRDETPGNPRITLG